jgi:hypothetical protein
MGVFPSVALVSVLCHLGARMEMSRVRKKAFTVVSPFTLSLI